jgi:hypothetical protein
VYRPTVAWIEKDPRFGVGADHTIDLRQSGNARVTPTS